MNEKHYCCCCARQITKNGVSSDYECPGPVKFMGPTLGVICSECSNDLDEDGLFPEERGSKFL